MFIYFPERERDRDRETMSVRESRGGAERERHRIRSRLPDLSYQHRAQRGARTQGPQDHDLSQSQPLNRLSHLDAPKLLTYLHTLSSEQFIHFNKYFMTFIIFHLGTK